MNMYIINEFLTIYRVLYNIYLLDIALKSVSTHCYVSDA